MDTPDHILDRALDGEASREDTRSIEQSEQLTQDLELLQTIGRGLKGAYPPPAAPESLFDRRAARPSGWASALRVLAYAATIALLASVWFVARPGVERPEIHAVPIYNRIAHDMTPDHVCSTPDEFEAYTREHLGTTITAAFATPVELVGWTGLFGSYAGETPEPGRTLMATDESGRPVVVFFALARIDAPSLDDRPDLRVFTRRFGPIAAYEVSALDRPAVLPLLERVE